MQQAYEGFGKAVKAVLKSQEKWRSGVAGAVAELIDVPRDYVTAIEIALGGNMQNIVTADTDTAKAAILSSSGKSRDALPSCHCPHWWSASHRILIPVCRGLSAGLIRL